MINLRNELTLIAMEIHELLNKYIIIHDAVFKFSLREIIPLPFIFNPIDFYSLHDESKNIISELETCNNQIDNLKKEIVEDDRQFINILSEYCVALIETVSLLNKIIFRLYLKGERSNRYSWWEYNKHCNLYKNSVKKYKIIGHKINEFFKN